MLGGNTSRVVGCVGMEEGGNNVLSKGWVGTDRGKGVAGNIDCGESNYDENVWWKGRLKIRRYKKGSKVVETECVEEYVGLYVYICVSSFSPEHKL